MGKHVWRGDVWSAADNGVQGPDRSRANSLEGGLDPRPRQGGRFLFYLVLALLGGVLAVGGVWLTWERLSGAYGAPQPVNLLVLGVDERSEDAGRSDTIMVAAFNPAARVARVVSIPRDTRVMLPGRSWHEKINSAYGIGGPDLTRQAVEGLLGIRIDYYVMVNFEGFKRAVDSLGGVELDVEQAMDYEDRAQGLKIHLKKGRQRLNGQEALGYVRYRSDGLGDVSLTDPVNQVYEGRVRRQQRFVMSLASQALKPKNVWRLPAVAKALFSAVETDMPISKVLQYAKSARKMESSSVATELLPGLGDTVGGVSYWLPDETGLTALADRIQAVPEAAPAKPKLPVGKIALPVLKLGTAADDKVEGRIEVLNGSGITGLAKKAADQLASEGFTVVVVGNADQFGYETTRLYGANPGQGVIKAMEKVLGTVEVQERSADRQDIDFSVIVGRSYQP